MADVSEDPSRDPGSRRKAASSSSRRTAVRERYGAIASGETADDAGEDRSAEDGCCSGSDQNPGSCCSDGTAGTDNKTLGYEPTDLSTAPPEADLGLGCGNPKTIAALQAGESVLDLGSGGGFDCFLAAHEVGPTGRVIGVDMTPEMVERARTTARRRDLENVEFRLGEIEHLPVADETVDVVVSNCVINLSSAKPRVFEDAFRVLKPGVDSRFPTSS